MPVDTRRLPIPDESTSPLVYVETTATEEDLVKDGKRGDGRSCEQLRPIFVRSGTITQAKGSAYMELNHTKVICAVYGPREVTKREEFSMKGQLSCEFKFATFSSATRRQHQQDSEEKALSALIQEALEPVVLLEKFPKARMDIFITVLQDDGGCVSAALSCASLALADAGVEMYDLVVGCSLRQNGGNLLLDPTSSEEYNKLRLNGGSKNEGGLLVGYMPSLDQVSALTQEGQMELATVNKGLKLCVETCQKIYPVLQQCLNQSVKVKLHDKST